MQDRHRIAINRHDTIVTNSKQLETAIPASKISSLSSGAFVGLVADDPGEKIELKAFCSEIINDHKSIAKEQSTFKELPAFARLDQEVVIRNFAQVKDEVTKIVKTELQRMMDTPELNELLVRKQ